MVRADTSRWTICWYPPNVAMLDGKNPGHAAKKCTRPYEWLRREAISNLIIMQALSRPRHPRRVLTPGQGAEDLCV